MIANDESVQEPRGGLAAPRNENDERAAPVRKTIILHRQSQVGRTVACGSSRLVGTLAPAAEPSGVH